MCMVSINVDEATLRDMRPEELYAVIMEDAKAIYTMANTDKWYYAYKNEATPSPSRMLAMHKLWTL